MKTPMAVKSTARCIECIPPDGISNQRARAEIMSTAASLKWNQIHEFHINFLRAKHRTLITKPKGHNNNTVVNITKNMNLERKAL